MGLHLTGSSLTQLNNAYVRGVGPSGYGAVGDGTTDDTTALQNWLTSGGTALVLPKGTYAVSSQLSKPVGVSILFMPGAVIKATASIASILTTPPGSADVNSALIGPGILDCNRLAATGFNPTFFQNLTIRDLRVANALGDFLVLGDGTSPSYGAALSGVLCYSSVAVTSGARGLFVQCSDSSVSQSVFIGADIGIRNNGNNNKFSQCHAWGHATFLPSVCFDDNATGTTWTDCVADTPTLYGFRLRQFRTQIKGGFVYNNAITGAVDNTVVGIQFDQASNAATVVGIRFEGADVTHRIAADFGGTLTTTNIVGCSWNAYVTSKVTQPLLTPGIVAADGAAGTNVDYRLKRAGVDRWVLRMNNTSEAGANAGSNLDLITRNDDGSANLTPFQINRATGLVTLNYGLALNGALTTNAAALTSIATALGRGPAMVTGTIYTCPVTAVGTSVPAEATMRAHEFRPAASCTLSALVGSVTSGGTAGALVRLGIYSDSNGKPGTLLVDAGTGDATATGLLTVTTTQALVAGTRYWLAFVVQGAAVTRPTVRQASVPSDCIGDTAGTTVLDNALSGYQAAGTVSGALPSTTTWSATANIYRVGVKVA